MLSTRAHITINLILFQAAWFICVVSASKGMGEIGIAVVGAVIAIHLIIAARSSSSATPLINEGILIIIACLVGLIWETILLNLSLVKYYNHSIESIFPPLWLLALWPLFATGLNVSLRWLHKPYRMAALFGAIGGPISFYAGSKLGAVTFPTLAISMSVLAIGWAFLVPLMMAFASKFDGFEPSQVTPPNEIKATLKTQEHSHV